MVRPGQVLSHYEILEPLGQGGMGEVFLARDTVLGRKVALKFLPEKTRDVPVARERFLREGRTAAALDDPFICKIYDAGEADGEPFIAMEYVEGETLRERLQRGPLPVETAIKAATEIAEAMEVAHAHDIIHRDLKPPNVMLTPQGHAKVMDFGLAKEVVPLTEVDQEAATPARPDLTRTGAVVGTPAYMSPEQLRGETLDARSDIFAFGVLVQEMISGAHPFARPSAAETVKAIMVDRPLPLPVKETGIPAGLEPILSKALAKQPEDRYQTTGDLVADLRALGESLTGRRRRIPLSWLAAGLALVMVTSAASVWLAVQRRQPVAVAERAPLSVLVADFDNRTGDEVFDGVLEEATVIGLEGAPFINSYKRGRARRVAGEIRADAASLDQEMARLVAQREGIEVVVTGHISRAGDGYEISVAALDALTGKALARHRDQAGDKSEVLASVGELAGRTRASLGDSIPESAQLAARETFTASSLDAAHAYAMGGELLGAGKWQEAIREYSRAVELDPDLGRAYAGMAVASANMVRTDESRKYYEMAMARIDRMTDREKHRTRGGYYLMTRSYAKAIEEFDSLVEKYPSDLAGLSNLPLAHFYGRNMARALEEGRKAVEAYPDHTPARANLALYAMYAGDFETGVAQAKSLLESQPGYETAYVCLAVSQLALGRSVEATQTYARLREVSGWGASLAATGLADIALYEGRLADAAAILEKAVTNDLTGGSAGGAARKLATLSRIHLVVGRPTEALAAAQRAVEASRQERVLFEAARVFVGAGDIERAVTIAGELGQRLEPEPQAFAKLIEGEMKLQLGDARQAVSLFEQAQGHVDTWLGRFALGRAYVESRAFTEAHAELERCLRRRGEATAIFLDDVPTYHYLPPVHYYLARAQEGLQSPAAAASYREFLTIKESAGDEDPLVADARRRLADS